MDVLAVRDGSSESIKGSVIKYSTIRHSGVVTKILQSYSDGMNTDETSVTDVKAPNLTEGSSHSVPRVP